MNYWRAQSQLPFLLLGIVLLKVDQWFNHSEDTKITYLTAFNRIIPMPRYGSRGLEVAPALCGMSQKLTRTSAAEFLAVPTMFGATAKKCYDYYKDGFVLTHDQIN
jgi:undecaprenyl-diphosphatase